MKPLSVGLDETLARIERMRQKAKEQGQTAPKAPETAQVIKLPVWVESVRAVPNGVLRSALFGAIARGKRRYMREEEIASIEGIEIRYTGERLDQGDLDVWECVLHLIREQALGKECRFTAYSLLKMLGKNDAGTNRKILNSRLMRLKANALQLKQGRYSYAGSLIDEVYQDEETREYIVVINPKLKVLFEPDQFTQVQWSIRQALDGQPLAQWLHGFFSSHAQPYPIKIETLHKLCGSEAKRISDFKVDLKRSMQVLSDVSNAHEQRFNFGVNGGLIEVNRQPTKSQNKHLQKAIPRKK